MNLLHFSRCNTDRTHAKGICHSQYNANYLIISLLSISLGGLAYCNNNYCRKTKKHRQKLNTFHLFLKKTKGEGC